MAIVGVASVRIKPDLTTFRKELNAELKAIKAEVQVAVKIDTAKATADVDKFLAEQSKKSVKIKAEVDSNQLKDFGKALDGLTAPMARIGIAAVAFTAIQTVLQGIVPLLISATGAALLLPGALAAAGIAAVTVKLGMDGIKKAFNALNPTLKTLKAQVSATFTTGLAPAVQNLKTLIPQLSPGLRGVAAALSAVAVSFTVMLKSNANVAILKGLLNSTKVIITNVGSALAPVVQAFLTIAGVAAGTLKDLTSGFGAAATKFSQFITNAANTGQIFDWIKGGLAALTQLGQIAVQAGKLVLSVFSGLAAGGGNLGGTLLPVLKAINTALASPAGQAALAALGGAMVALGKAVSGTLVQALGAMLPLITGILNVIAAHGQTVVNLGIAIFGLAKGIAIASAAMKAWTVVATALDISLDANPIGAIVLAIAALITVAILVIANWSKVSAFFATVGNAIAKAFHAAIDWVAGAFQATVGAITRFFGSIGSFFSGIGAKISAGFQNVVSFFAGLPAKIGSFLTSLPSVIGNALLTALKFAGTVVVQGLEWIIASFVALPLIIMRTLITFVTTLVTWAQTTGAQVVIAVVTWLGELVNWFIGLPGRIIGAVSGFLGMMVNWAQTTGAQVVIAVVTWLANVVSFFVSLPGRIISAVSSFGAMIGTWMRNAISSLVSALPSIAAGVGSFFTGLPGRIQTALGNLGSLLIDAGKAIINGLLNGLKAAVSAVWSFVGGIADKIKSLKGPLPYDKKLLIPAGNAIMQGLHDGLSQGFKPVQDLVGGMADQLATSFGSNTLGSSLTAQVSGSLATTVNAAASIAATPVVVNVASNPPGIKDFINVQIDGNNRSIVRSAKAGIGGTTT